VIRALWRFSRRSSLSARNLANPTSVMDEYERSRSTRSRNLFQSGVGDGGLDRQVEFRQGLEISEIAQARLGDLCPCEIEPSQTLDLPDQNLTAVNELPIAMPLCRSRLAGRAMPFRFYRLLRPGKDFIE
jgi:hypothetical protein